MPPPSRKTARPPRRTFRPSTRRSAARARRRARKRAAVLAHGDGGPGRRSCPCRRRGRRTCSGALRPRGARARADARRTLGARRARARDIYVDAQSRAVLGLRRAPPLCACDARPRWCGATSSECCVASTRRIPLALGEHGLDDAKLCSSPAPSPRRSRTPSPSAPRASCERVGGGEARGRRVGRRGQPTERTRSLRGEGGVGGDRGEGPELRRTPRSFEVVLPRDVRADDVLGVSRARGGVRGDALAARTRRTLGVVKDAIRGAVAPRTTAERCGASINAARRSRRARVVLREAANRRTGEGRRRVRVRVRVLSGIVRSRRRPRVALGGYALVRRARTAELGTRRPTISDPAILQLPPVLRARANEGPSLGRPVRPPERRGRRRRVRLRRVGRLARGLPRRGDARAVATAIFFLPRR